MDALADVGTAAHDDVLPEDGLAANLGKMPDRRTVADGHTVVQVGGVDDPWFTHVGRLSCRLHQGQLTRASPTGPSPLHGDAENSAWRPAFQPI